MKKTAFFFAGFLTALNLTAFAATFTDEGLFSDWNREAILNIQEKGLMTGYEDGSFGPNNYVTRAELATVLERMENRMPILIDKYIEEKSVDIIQENNPEAPQEASIDNDAILGGASAPLTIVEFSDFQCPYCAKFHQETLPLIKKTYIDTGKVRLVLRDFPLTFHTDAKNAAMAAECVKAQGGDELYWTYADLLFKNQLELSVSKLKEYAHSLSLDPLKFNTCLDDSQFEEEIQNDLADGKEYGVGGTPTFFLGQKMITGAQPYSVFEAAIEEALQANE